MNTRKKRPASRIATRGARVAIVRARWNEDVTLALEGGAIERAGRAGASVDLFAVAGSFELPAAVALLAAGGQYDAIIPLGCLIRGETAHFEVLAHAVARGLLELSMSYPVAITFGVLTVESMEQAVARAGGSEGNLGADAMDAALELVTLRQAVASKAVRSRPRARARSRSTR